MPNSYKSSALEFFLAKLNHYLSVENRENSIKVREI